MITSKRTLLILTLIPILLLIVGVTLFSVNVLFGDEWVIWSNILFKIEHGELTVTDLIAQNNEQRMLSARIFGLLTKRIFALNRLVASYINIVIAIGIFSLFVRLYMKTKKEMHLPNCNWPIIIISSLIFSLIQWYTFFNGMMNTFLLPLLCMLGALNLMSNQKLSILKFFCLVFLGFIGSFHVASGLFFWIVILIPMLNLNIEKRVKHIYIVFTLASGTISGWLYFINYTSPPHHPSPLSALTAPLTASLYFSALIGKAIISANFLYPLALIIGMIGLLILIKTIIQLKENNFFKHQTILIWLSIILYSLLSLLAITAGRSGFGVRHALQSRYATYSNLFWVALLVLSIINTKSLFAERVSSKYQSVLRYFTFLCIFLFIFSSIFSVFHIYNRYEKFNIAKQELFSLDEPDKLKPIFPVPQYLYAVLPIFFKERLTLFHDIKKLSDYKKITDLNYGSLNSIKHVSKKRTDGLLLSGKLRKTAQYILITAEKKIIYISKPKKNMLWKIFIPNNFFSTQDITLEIYALNKKNEIAELHSNVSAKVKINSLSLPPYDLSRNFYAIDVLQENKK